MKNYTSVHDIDSFPEWVEAARNLKKDPLAFQNLGKNKTLGLLFFNNSLRTRLSTQKAALNLGMNTIVMNFGNEGWTLEFEDGGFEDAFVHFVESVFVDLDHGERFHRDVAGDDAVGTDLGIVAYPPQ